MNIFKYNNQMIYVDNLKYGVLKLGVAEDNEEKWFVTINLDLIYRENIIAELKQKQKDKDKVFDDWKLSVSVYFSDTIRAYLSAYKVVCLNEECYDGLWDIVIEKLKPVFEQCLRDFIEKVC
jgi:hypothetical protein